MPISSDTQLASQAVRLPARLVDLGRMSYEAAYQRQLEAVEQRKIGAIPDVLFLVEHPHVITVGRAQKAMANVLMPGEVEVVAVERGGDVTYHGPGQLVAYPIVYLDQGERDLHRFLRHLEEAMIRTLAHWGIAGAREPGKTGVWTARQPSHKLASIGIACRRWVTFHGLALNVTTDLTYFQRINPCGFGASVMTSMAGELGTGDIDLAAVKKRLAGELGSLLGRNFTA